MCEVYTLEQDKNKNGIIDDDELTDEQKVLKERSKLNLKDINKLFIFIYIFTLVFLVIKFCSWFFFKISINISADKLANCLNLFIVIVGTCEGFRSFIKTSTSEESMPVPSWKLRYLFIYLVSFAILTVIAVGLEFTVKFTADPSIDTSILPQFSSDEFISGVVSNVVAYLIARYGNKVSENIDLSKIKMFKK